jgi:hypothetical protein
VLTVLALTQVHGGTPTFAVEDGPPPPASPRFTCNLVIPAVQTPQGGFSEMHFTAFARSKKGAEHAAAEKALDFIMSMGLLQAPAKTSVVPFLAPSAGSDISLEEVSSPCRGELPMACILVRTRCLGRHMSRRGAHARC